MEGNGGGGGSFEKMSVPDNGIGEGQLETDIVYTIFGLTQAHKNN